jgi:uncharacterized membrane protein
LISSRSGLETSRLFWDHEVQPGKETMAMDGPDLFWGPWVIWPVLFWITLIWLMKLGVSRRAHFRHRSGHGDPAEEILRERYARGEITADEHERSLGALRGRSPEKGYEDYVREAEEELRSETEGRPRQ